MGRARDRALVENQRVHEREFERAGGGLPVLGLLGPFADSLEIHGQRLLGDDLDLRVHAVLFITLHAADDPEPPRFHAGCDDRAEHADSCPDLVLAGNVRPDAPGARVPLPPLIDSRRDFVRLQRDAGALLDAHAHVLVHLGHGAQLDARDEFGGCRESVRDFYIGINLDARSLRFGVAFGPIAKQALEHDQLLVDGEVVAKPFLGLLRVRDVAVDRLLHLFARPAGAEIAQRWALVCIGRAAPWPARVREIETERTALLRRCLESEAGRQPCDDACREFEFEQCFRFRCDDVHHEQPQKLLAHVGRQRLGRVRLDDLRDAALLLGLGVQRRELPPDARLDREVAHLQHPAFGGERADRAGHEQMAFGVRRRARLPCLGDLLQAQPVGSGDVLPEIGQALPEGASLELLELGIAQENIESSGCPRLPRLVDQLQHADTILEREIRRRGDRFEVRGNFFEGLAVVFRHVVQESFRLLDVVHRMVGSLAETA